MTGRYWTDPYRTFTVVHTPSGAEPRWLHQPDMTMILHVAQAALGINSPEDCSIEDVSLVGFFKSYILRLSGKEYMMRLYLPVLPRWKTESEVAIMEWVRRKTTLPVPRVCASMHDNRNYIGYEWIIEEKPRGVLLADIWRKVSLSTKKRIVRRLAVFVSETFRHQARGIGSLYYSESSAWRTLESCFAGLRLSNDDSSDSYTGNSNLDSMVVGPSVDSMFVSICDNRFPHGPAGPFSSAQQWILARIDFYLEDNYRRMRALELSQYEQSEWSESNDGSEAPADDDLYDSGEDINNLQVAINNLLRLKPLVNHYFPANETLEPEPSIVYHNDLEAWNIVVDENDPGSIIAVKDWESLSTVPLSVGCALPPFLLGKHCSKKPNKATYDILPDAEDLYWEHLMRYELTKLRKVFLNEMRTLQPEWVEIYEASQRQRDFDIMISATDEFVDRRRLCKMLTHVGAAEMREHEESLDTDEDEV